MLSLVCYWLPVVCTKKDTTHVSPAAASVLPQEVAVNAVQEHVHSLRAQGRKLEATHAAPAVSISFQRPKTNIANHGRWFLDFDSSLALLWNVFFLLSPILFIKEDGGLFQKFPLFLLGGTIQARTGGFPLAEGVWPFFFRASLTQRIGVMALERWREREREMSFR